MNPFEKFTPLELASLFDCFETMEEDGRHSDPEHQEVANKIHSMIEAAANKSGFDLEDLAVHSMYRGDNGFIFH